MASTRRYYDDGYTRSFEGRIVASGEHAGRPAVELEETWFYPESGGQLGDHGTIGGASVLDVQAADDGRVWHVVDAAPSAPADGAAPCAIDWTRRFDHMQQHTGQHVLSAALERECGWATLSSTLGAERSVIEISTAEVDWRTIERVERAANRLLWEDREIRLHWTDAASVGRFALRKPPQVDGPIRIVEIPDWDLSACGGTHTRRTGEVGVVKVTGWEKVRGNVRLGSCAANARSPITCGAPRRSSRARRSARSRTATCSRISTARWKSATSWRSSCANCVRSASPRMPAPAWAIRPRRWRSSRSRVRARRRARSRSRA
ncbi:MAG: alanyl-tRNA editing protein [Candidatus Eisenbacteria bacterium]|nr:alanyl-tRNA editing protein [Candidatus Eisenbacteria bacterium]